MNSLKKIRTSAVHSTVRTHFVLSKYMSGMQSNTSVTSGAGGSNAVKFDQDKYRFSLLPTDALAMVAQVGTMGAQKYGDHNWKQGAGLSWSRLLDAHYRHVFAWSQGELVDPESKLPHLAHAAWNLLALLHYSAQGLGTNNIHALPVPPAPSSTSATTRKTMDISDVPQTLKK